MPELLARQLGMLHTVGVSAICSFLYFQFLYRQAVGRRIYIHVVCRRSVRRWRVHRIRFSRILRNGNEKALLHVECEQILRLELCTDNCRLIAVLSHGEYRRLEHLYMGRWRLYVHRYILQYNQHFTVDIRHINR